MRLELVKEGVDDGVWLWQVTVSSDRVWMVRIAQSEDELFNCALTPPGEPEAQLAAPARLAPYLALDDALAAIELGEAGRDVKGVSKRD